MNDFQRQYLHEMGIDVWLLRPEKLVVADDVAQQLDAPKARMPVEEEKSSQLSPAASNLSLVRDQLAGESARAPSVASKAPEPVVSPPQFLLCFLDYVNLSLVFSLPYKTSALPNEYRNFGDDINFAVNGQYSSPRVRDLRWPMVQAAHIQQTEDDAKQVVHQKLLQCHSRVFIFGQGMSGYFGESAGSRNIGDSIEFDNKRLLILNDVSHYFENQQDKRNLWRFIRNGLQ